MNTRSSLGAENSTSLSFWRTPSLPLTESRAGKRKAVIGPTPTKRRSVATDARLSKFIDVRARGALYLNLEGKATRRIGGMR